MSTVIQAIVYPLTSDSMEKIDNLMLKTSNSIYHAIDEYRKFKTIGIILSKFNQGRVFNNTFNELPVEISALTHQALLILYDNRIGYRCSCIFRNGEFIKEFSSECDGDEIWVLIDDDCNPLPDRKFSLSQLDQDDNEDNEYMTLTNAIDRGLAEIGICEDWQEIVELCY